MKCFTETIDTTHGGIKSASLSMQDITAPDICVEVSTIPKGPSGITIHVNVDGQCVLRICRIPHLTMAGCGTRGKDFILQEPMAPKVQQRLNNREQILTDAEMDELYETDPHMRSPYKD